MKKGDLFYVCAHFSGGDCIAWSMEKRIFWKAFAGWGIGLSAALWMICLSLTVFGAVGEGAEPDLTVRREGEGLWSLRISSALVQRVGDDPVALLMEIDLPRDLRVVGIRKGKGAEGLVLNHGDLSAHEVRVLLDGRLSEGEILWIQGEKHPHETAKEGGYVGVTGANGDELVLFVLREDGRVERIPVSVMVEEWETEKDPPEDVTERESEPREDPPAEFETMAEVTDTEYESPPTESTEETKGQSGEVPPLPCFLGCRETGVTDGKYTVQFLFAGHETPVVCMEGGDLLTVTCGTVEPVTGGRGSWSACTFTGLFAGRRYVFWVYTAEGWITAVYEEGRFAGYGQNAALGYGKK